jgi:hypothetical protein
MAIWSLATQRQDDGVIDVSLYPTEYRAYEALANIMFDDSVDPRRDALLSKLRELPADSIKMDVFYDTLKEIGLNVTVTGHKSPAPIAFGLRADLNRKINLPNESR